MWGGGGGGRLQPPKPPWYLHVPMPLLPDVLKLVVLANARPPISSASAVGFSNVILIRLSHNQTEIAQQLHCDNIHECYDKAEDGVGYRANTYLTAQCCIY